MNGEWMTFLAEVLSRPHVTDVGPYLAHGLQRVQAHREIAAASFEHDPTTHTVRFHVQLHYPIAPHIDALTGHRALHESLERAGFGDTSLPAYAPVPVRLRIGSWPINL